MANARGAAFLAGLALGHLKVDDIPQRVKIAATYHPVAGNRRLYDELFREFTGVYKRNRKMFARLNA